MTGTADEFRALGIFDGDGRGLHRAAKGTDYDIAASEWLVEASPYSNDTVESQASKWGRAFVSYNAWAAGVGRAPATLDDLIKAGAQPMLRQMFTAVVSWPAWQHSDTDFTTWTDDDLIEQLATLRARGLAGAWLAADGSIADGAGLRLESTQHVEVAISGELERRSIRS